MGLYEAQNTFIVKHNRQPNFTTSVSEANNALVLNYQDNGHTCCPTSNSMGICMLFDYHSETDLARLFGTTTSGTSPSSMVAALNNLGYHCTRMNRTLENVTNSIKKGFPVVCHYQTKPASACTGFKYDYGHYCLIYGVQDGKYLIADPTKGFKKCIPSVMNNATNGRAIYYYSLSPR
jgi:ABC-type bacteriocin/lantibiotic exporter with double-glycine peptidase domain